MTKEYATTYLRCSGFSDEQIKAIEGAFSCPSAVVDCEDCPAYEDTISRREREGMTREEIKNTPELVNFLLDKSLIADSRMKLHKRLEIICNLAIKALEQESKSEWQQDHEILKAYSDGANDVLDKIRAEIEQMNNLDYVEPVTVHEILQIIDNYKTEGGKE